MMVVVHGSYSIFILNNIEVHLLPYSICAVLSVWAVQHCCMGLTDTLRVNDAGPVWTPIPIVSFPDEKVQPQTSISSICFHLVICVFHMDC